jgi:hypothetical protein
LNVRVYEAGLEGSADYIYDREDAANPSVLVRHRARKPLVLLAFEDSGNIISTESATGKGNWSAEVTITAGEYPVLFEDPATRAARLFYFNGSALCGRSQIGSSWGAEVSGPALASIAGFSIRVSHLARDIWIAASDETDVKLTKSIDLGRTWAAWTTVAQGTYPHLLIDRATGLMWLVYYRAVALYLRRGSIAGSFGEEIEITTAGTLNESEPTLRFATGRQARLALWYFTDDGDLHLMRSADGGVTWT